ncbi:hypothetical protein COU87_01095 [Candidatus Roizmanbacteria bacterium CG10_big_fil_rev_8_21_14_0_10_39_12]|uniref:Carbamoyl transferase n=1 Tax=Candidatus Roizmanbacteria bacterium CG10_big_fil_rev_8_21_14_0_10_39_12 TaxID=1974852 RepID=A0A2M8KQA3_9BACT|nr:MAG: hypothetical protein COY15_00165 [Candidatus Roizmanbacteria bacterium CG_4_10_14_0_2_um_filter_39_12]PJE62107.1 MAG: hypothetical protein COU87_01095 [Candidatus Roizmanbacteria bacterium CG10_big_fil_rev_8_21_14_0_10_39_12]
MYILGIHIGHDSTAVLFKDGVFLEAMSEERLSRQKKHAGFPHLTVAYLKEKYQVNTFTEVALVGVELDDTIMITKEDNEAIRKNGISVSNHFLRAVGVKFPLLGSLFNLRDWVLVKVLSFGIKAKVDKFLRTQFPEATITRVEHHLAHAWSVIPFLPDLNKKYLVLTMDGAGDDLSGSVNILDQGQISRKHVTSIHSSVGLLYCAIVDILGMSRNEHEFKVMGLAPYAKVSAGEKVYEKLKKLVWFDHQDLSFKSAINLDRATPYLLAHNFFWHRFDSLAYGIQKLTEESIKEMTLVAINKYQISDVAVAGGVFMNVKANQYVREMSAVKSFSVTPSCGDESLAFGAVMSRYNTLMNGDLSKVKQIDNLYLGSEYSDVEIKKEIDKYDFPNPVKVEYFAPDAAVTIEHKAAEILANNGVVGRFKGRAEWGARALGNRSILANPKSLDNVKLINEMIKGRDFWMPFATSMLYERRNDYLVNAENYLAPYMAITFNTKPLAHTELIAALHPYDLTSRPQMVEKKTNPEYHNLISHFESLTGVGGILNTSFNLHGEPNVENPYDALRTFSLSGLNYLAIGNYLVYKT